MKKILFAFFLSCFTFEINAQVCDCEIDASLIHTVNEFNLNENWNMINNEYRSFEFEYQNNQDLDLSIMIGQPFPFEVALDDLQQEIDNFFFGNAGDLPLLSYAFQFMDQGNEGGNFTSFDYSRTSQIQIGRVTWLNFRCTSEVVTESYYFGDYLTTEQFNRDDYFLAIVNNRVYAVIFSAPFSSFVDYENIIMESIISLSNLVTEVIELSDIIYLDDPYLNDPYFEDDDIYLDDTYLDDPYFEEDGAYLDPPYPQLPDEEEVEESYYDEDLFIYDDFSNDG